MYRDSAKPRAPLAIYDADCAFCVRMIARWHKRTGSRIHYAPLQNGRLLRKLAIPRSVARQSLQLVEADGRRFSGARAAFGVLARAPGLRWLSFVGRLPVVRTIAEWVYRRVAKHRKLAARIEKIFFTPRSTRLVRWIFPRAMGAVYLIAFTSLRSQLLGLYGKRGLLPISDFLDSVRAVAGRDRHRLVPSLLWLDASDAGLIRLCDGGQWCAALLVAGVAPRVMSAASWLIYLSFVSAGRDFLGFQWDALLLESGLDTIIAAPPGLLPRLTNEDTPWPVVLLMRWLVFRLHFESGLCKLQSRDPTWRRCTACTFHHQTQPLPTPLGWHAHQLPRRFQQLSTLLTLIIECGVPFFVFAPRRPRRVAFLILSSLQALIAASGNYGFFNLLTAVLDLWLLDDDMIRRSLLPRALLEPSTLFRSRQKPPRRARWWRRWLSFVAGAPIVALSGAVLLARLRLLRSLPRAVGKLHTLAAPLHAVNSYGLFAVMTTSRPEIIIEGSNDRRTWHAYEFRYKPGALNRGPRFVAPHQPRLDWQMWFAALGSPPAWFEGLLSRLLEGSPEVLQLIAHNPFPEHPPRFVRALLYDYRMTDRQTRKQTGNFWQRELLGLYFPTCRLARPHFSDEESRSEPPVYH